MELKLMDKRSFYHEGYGVGSGEVIKDKYKCPCGNGIVVYEKDDIPDFKDSSISNNCKECISKYDLGRGTAVEKNISN